MDRAYREAEARLRESIALRAEVFWRHTYPDRVRDLETMRAYHEEHGTPPTGPQRGDVETVLGHLSRLEADDG